MSLSSLQSAVDRLQRDLEGLHRQLADEASKVAQKSARMARLEDEATRSPSGSSIQGKLREAARLRGDIAAIQRRQADLTRKVADKQRDLHRAQSDLQKEQARESTGLLSSLRRQTLETQSRALFQVRALADTPVAQELAFDAFICHASEDKEELVRPLADALTAQGLRIWYDEFALKVGDSLRRSIDKGLVRSRYGIVVLSPSFFAKSWPQYELDGLVAKEMTGTKVVLPIWHRVTKDDVLGYSPTLADRLALSTAVLSVAELVAKLSEVLRPDA